VVILVIRRKRRVPSRLTESASSGAGFAAIVTLAEPIQASGIGSLICLLGAGGGMDLKGLRETLFLGVLDGIRCSPR
ncbi:hypothetical protein ABZV60_34700, partial [Streptomyces sp. NPDC004787]|uniref:hypothetical protein n=1 Tax=Streptomyces sp. NPDC004787 TaxID=3154291 RepID=UPI0033AF3A42